MPTKLIIANVDGALLNALQLPSAEIQAQSEVVYSIVDAATGSSTYVYLSSTTTSSQLTTSGSRLIHSAIVSIDSAARIGYFAQLPSSIASWDGAVLTLA